MLVLGDVITRAIGQPLAVGAGSDHDVLHLRHLHRRRRGHAAQRPLYLAVLAELLTGNKRLFFEMFNRLVVLAVALCMIYFGYLNFLDGFKSLRMPSMTPMASLYAAIPISGALVALFTIEQMVNGWRHGFADPAGAHEEKRKSL